MPWWGSAALEPVPQGLSDPQLQPASAMLWGGAPRVAVCRQTAATPCQPLPMQAGAAVWTAALVGDLKATVMYSLQKCGHMSTSHIPRAMKVY